ncbi:AAA family ATPase [Shimia sediminis]|uniref:AAA family ATPase n=1 Tax=Shimia sediminis TaxID=2497945 RepID=UPI000F8F076E|nr:ATP-binding protein [Shimia sediminis]
MVPSATLHILCGKIASGKSTLAAELTSAPHTVALSEDTLLAALYEGEMKNVSDYVRNSARLRAGLTNHVVSLLQAGTNVVLDFAANTADQRAWMIEIVKSAKCQHLLHFLDVPDEVCRARLKARNVSGDHPFSVTDEQFNWITAHFLAPDPSEGFIIRSYP